jgi:extracellular factor (EF) 3-hydroxypalmitic acid methyl ester biosynthesis protein
MSVTQLIKYMSQPMNSPLGVNFDLIYCGGLFDYLSDQMCRQLVSLFYEWIAPGGLVLVANMNDQQRPFRYMVEYLLDWHLIYRDARCMASFAPEKTDNWSVIGEPVAVNLFLEARKPQGN